jgi:hypothetical protein
MWLADDSLHEDLRPDRCHVVLEYADENNVLAFVDVSHPDAWKKDKVSNIISTLLAKGCSVSIAVGDARYMLLPEGKTSEEVMKDLQSILEKNKKWPHQSTEQT